MSLRVWLPLNGNLNNQGLSDIAVTNNGATVDNNGKIGKCYSFGTASSYLEMPPTVMNTFTDECSISMWLYITSWNTNYATIFQAGKGGQPWDHYVFGVLRNERSSKLCFTITQGTSSSQASYTTPDLSLATWYHLTFVYKPGHCLIYVNGSLYQDYTTSYTPSFDKITKITVGKSNNITYQSNCKLNDFRIYDHALSPKEIEILSRGLVCHYPLNGGGRGGDNLLTNTVVNTANQALLATNYNSRWSELIIETINEHTCYKYPKAQSSTWFATGYWGGYLKANTTYTYSAWIYFTASSNTSFNFTSLGHFQVYNSNSTASDKAHEDVVEARIYEPSTIPPNTWTKIRITFTTNSLANSKFQIYPRYAIGANVGDLYFRDMKLEETDHVTPWMPNPADSAYTAMGYNSTTEYDVSGYGYNGTKNGTVVYNSDTARYDVSTVFNGTNTYIESNPLPTETATIACWLKTTWTSSSGYRIAVHDKNSGLAIGWSETRLITYIGSSAGSTGSMIETNGTWTANAWHHVTVVKTGSTTRDVYIDGVKMATSGGNWWGGDLNKLNIGNRHVIGSYSAYWDGQISDFRAYATALSAAQVAELYNTAVSVANNGTLMGYELVEV